VCVCVCVMDDYAEGSKFTLIITVKSEGIMLTALCSSLCRTIELSRVTLHPSLGAESGQLYECGKCLSPLITTPFALLPVL
jgi:hypothetical protein